MKARLNKKQRQKGKSDFQSYILMYKMFHSQQQQQKNDNEVEKYSSFPGKNDFKKLPIMRKPGQWDY